MSLQKRLLSNGVASLFQKGVRVLDQLFLVPFFITSWGAAYYGEWLTLTIVPSVIGFSDMGFGTASGNSFILAYASGDKQKAADINKSGGYMITIMVIAAMLISALAILALDYFNVFEKSLIEKTDAIIAVSILILTRLLNFYSQLIQAYYRSAQRAALSINLLTIYSTVNLGVGLLILLGGYGVITFAFGQLLVYLIFIGSYYLIGRNLLGLFRTHIGHKNKNLIQDITRKGLGYLMSPVWQSVYFQGTTFVVRIVLGPESVAIFNTVRTLSRSLNQVFYMVKNTVFPELQFEIGRNNWATAQKIYRMSIIGVFLMSFIGFLFLSFFGLWFYNFWTQNQLEVPKLMWYVFVGAMLLNSMWWTTEMVFGAVNRPKKMAYYGVMASLVSVGLTYALSLNFDLVGAAIGAVSLDLILVFMVLPTGCNYMRMSLKDLVVNGVLDLKNLFYSLKVKYLGN